MIKNLVFCLLFLLNSCTAVNQDNPVKSEDSNLSPKKINDFINYPGSLCRPFVEYRDPAVVFVQTYSKETNDWHHCTGTLISNGFVLTAKHCVIGGVAKTQVFVLNKVPEIYFIKSSKLNDTAIIKIKLTKEIESIKPIEVAPSIRKTEVILGNIAGFGCIDSSQNLWALGRPAIVMTTVLPNNDEKLFISGCVCHGDSGGPFLNENNELVGIVYATYEDGQRGLAEDANRAIIELK